MSEIPYNWIICEGISEKIYFEHFFKGEIEKLNLRILPVGGFKDVKKVYDNLIAPIKDPDYIIKGKVFCLIDTDAETVNVDYKNIDNLIFKRVVTENKSKSTTLVPVNSNIANPITTIEDCLDPLIYKETLFKLTASNKPLNSIIENAAIVEGSQSSANCMDLRKSEEELIKGFFEENQGYNKVKFAEKYIELSKQEKFNDADTLNWINEIKKYFNS